MTLNLVDRTDSNTHVYNKTFFYGQNYFNIFSDVDNVYELTDII